MTISDIYIFRIWLSSLLFFLSVSTTISQTSYSHLHHKFICSLFVVVVLVFRVHFVNFFGTHGGLQQWMNDSQSFTLKTSILSILLIHNDVLTKINSHSLQQSWVMDLLSWDMLPDVRDPELTGLDWLGTTVLSLIIHITVSRASLIYYYMLCKKNKTSPYII